MSTPRLDSRTDPTAKHRAALARALGWPDEAAARGDDATALARVQTEAGGDGRETQRRVSGQAPRMASAG
jgi:hypothetical protein